MATYIKRGIGVKADSALALTYYRKSADLGSPEGQYIVSQQLYSLPHPARLKTAKQMERCAADQGHQEAAFQYAQRIEPTKSLPHYQKAVKNGSADAAYFLANKVFSRTLPPNDLDDMGVAADPERARRYNSQLFNILHKHYYLNTGVPELDEIVPLPPAPLPPWDGKIQWLKDWEANIPPPKPSEALITELARAKQLNPETGRPDPTQTTAK